MQRPSMCTRKPNKQCTLVLAVTRAMARGSQSKMNSEDRICVPERTEEKEGQRRHYIFDGVYGDISERPRQASHGLLCGE